MHKQNVLFSLFEEERQTYGVISLLPPFLVSPYGGINN
jgi:hypothetical protein